MFSARPGRLVGAGALALLAAGIAAVVSVLAPCAKRPSAPRQRRPPCQRRGTRFRPSLTRGAPGRATSLTPAAFGT